MITPPLLLLDSIDGRTVRFDRHTAACGLFLTPAFVRTRRIQPWAMMLVPLAKDTTTTMELKTVLPLINTSLIVVSGVALLVGYRFIRAGEIDRHKWAMLTATAFAALFLVVYVTRYLLYGSKIFAGEGAVRVVYLAILASHTILATAIVPMVLIVLYRGLSRQYARHRRLARKTLPIWLYVVFTGWVIYMMLYQFHFSNA